MTTPLPPDPQLVERDGRWYRRDGQRVWRAGTLVYDRRGLIRLMFFLFIGQFTFLLEVTALPMMLPLLFDRSLRGFEWSTSLVTVVCCFPPESWVSVFCVCFYLLGYE